VKALDILMSKTITEKEVLDAEFPEVAQTSANKFFLKSQQKPLVSSKSRNLSSSLEAIHAISTPSNRAMATFSSTSTPL
jgi:hypothetical protein